MERYFKVLQINPMIPWGQYKLGGVYLLKDELRDLGCYSLWNEDTTISWSFPSWHVQEVTRMGEVWVDVSAVTKIEAIPDNVNPSHYKKGKVECIDAIESATVGKSGFEGMCVGNVIKYLWRYEDKNGLEDVKKAQWYLAKLLDYLEGGEDE